MLQKSKFFLKIIIIILILIKFWLICECEMGCEYYWVIEWSNRPSFQKHTLIRSNWNYSKTKTAHFGENNAYSVTPTNLFCLCGRPHFWLMGKWIFENFLDLWICQTPNLTIQNFERGWVLKKETLLHWSTLNFANHKS